LTRTLAERLNDIREAARDAANIAATLDDSAFHALPPDLTARHPGVDWRGFAGLRDVVAHGYFGLRQELLLPVVRDEVPLLLAAIEAELKRSG
jgi:uncharacterized protein with HEPN domain